jgi:hypothetical protein
MIEECQTALKYLSQAETEDKKHKAVHENRKAFKKVRACLRLICDHIDFYGQENKWFRNLARRISGVRDATAHLETLEDELHDITDFIGTLHDLHNLMIAYKT